MAAATSPGQRQQKHLGLEGKRLRRTATQAGAAFPTSFLHLFHDTERACGLHFAPYLRRSSLYKHYFTVHHDITIPLSLCPGLLS